MGDTILIADDHPLFRQALALAVSNVAPQARVVEAGTLAAAAKAAAGRLEKLWRLRAVFDSMSLRESGGDNG